MPKRVISQADGDQREPLGVAHPPPRSDTAEKILDLAETLIQTRGYSAFSYQDIADAVGIRKASIHYHFASKTALGVAVLDRYSARFEAAITRMLEDPDVGAFEILDHYAQPYLDFSRTPDRVCLCGALAGEFLALPPEMRGRVERFFEAHQRWLAEIVERGRADGAFAPGQPAETLARSIFSTLQGALLVKRATGDAAQVTDVLKVIKDQLRGSATQ